MKPAKRRLAQLLRIAAYPLIGLTVLLLLLGFFSRDYVVSRVTREVGQKASYTKVRIAPDTLSVVLEVDRREDMRTVTSYNDVSSWETKTYKVDRDRWGPVPLSHQLWFRVDNRFGTNVRIPLWFIAVLAGVSYATERWLVAKARRLESRPGFAINRRTNRPAVFLDRDGVLNRTTVRAGTPYPPDTVEQLEILPGVADALKLLSDHGLPLIVVTNQPDVARGRQTRQTVEQINAKLVDELPMLSGVYVCYHDTPDNCLCRKPGPGMLIQAAAEHGIDLSRSFMVGDRWSDVVAGAAVGCRTFLLDVPYSQCHRCTPDHVVADLAEAAKQILSLLDSAVRTAASQEL